jgi:hypothetical protein
LSHRSQVKIKPEPINTTNNWKTLEGSLLVTSDDDSLSPLPSPSEMLKSLMKKAVEYHTTATSTTKASTISMPKKTVHSPKIPLSGISVKSKLDSRLSSIQITQSSGFQQVKDESDTLSTQSSSYELSDLEDNYKDDDYIQIAHLKLQKKEFTHVFPAFPKSHIDGYAYIIELNDEILNDKDLLNLRDGLQYSLTGGGGPKLHENVKFFAGEGQKVTMKVHSRQCAGNFLI